MHIKDNNLCLLEYSRTQTSNKKVQIFQDKITSLQNVYLNFFLTFQTNVIPLMESIKQAAQRARSNS